MRKIFIILSVFFMLGNFAKAQPYIDYTNPKQYTIIGISVSGIQFLSQDAIVVLSGLNIGQTIDVPGSQISNAINKLWGQGLFSDVKISITKTQADSIWLNIYLQEQPRLNKVYFYGVNKSQESDLRDKLGLSTGKQVTDNMLRTTEILIGEYFADKRYPFVDVQFKVVDDTLYQQTVNLEISIDKKNKVKINDIIIRGNTAFSDAKIKRFLKDTKQKNFLRFWKPSKYIKDTYKIDKRGIIAKYNQQGYRNAKIVEDSVYNVSDDRLNIYIKIDEGEQFYFRSIEWVGNTKYTSDQLTKILDIYPGDVYNQSRLQDRLYVDENAVGNLYYDQGYLFFSATPQEMNIENDSVDIRIFITEGPQAHINNVPINGNTRTNEQVIRRELRTLPGELFSRTDLIRSVRELANIGNFDPEQLAPTPIPNQQDGTVDVKFDVVERPNDVFELSGGWGYYGFMAQIGITFNNFSMQNIFKPKYWDPLPMGDGQKFSVSARVGGIRYQMYSLSYTNPWFGGKKPNSFTVSLYYNRMTNASYTGVATAHFNVIGTTVGLGRRLKKPDDYFVLSHYLSFDRYMIDDYQSYIDAPNGSYNIISLTNVLSRSSTDNPLYTRSGSDISLSLKVTPPYSFIFGNQIWNGGADSLKFKWAELYKFNFKASWYNEIFKNFVIMTKFEYGMLGYYNKNIGYTPFEGFDVGGSGFAGSYTFGVDYVALRGYDDHSFTPDGNSANLYTKYTVEFRYPIILKEMATLYVLSFLEAGNAWYTINDYNPFDVHRSVGVGARLFVPMLGLVGLDGGYGFDPIPGQAGAAGWNYHFTFGQQF
ncbi:MAG: outer membrane protein assembly factor BamA [Bacteroidales bacterium]|nr:outer membrane protein assembly factor BamA [Bacteroidales bacterium]